MRLSLSPPSPSSSPFRSHALFPSTLFLPLLLLNFSTTIAAAPYYEWTEDDPTIFETESAAGRAAAGAGPPASLTIPNTGTPPRIETTTDREIRTQTVNPTSPAPSPYMVPVIQITPTPPVFQVLNFAPTTSVPTISTTSLPEEDEQNKRMNEIVSNLTKKLESQNAGGTGSEISITFTPDELRKMIEIIEASNFKNKEAPNSQRDLFVPSTRRRIPVMVGSARFSGGGGETIYVETTDIVVETSVDDSEDKSGDVYSLPPEDEVTTTPVEEHTSSPLPTEDSEIEEMEELPNIENVPGYQEVEVIKPAICTLNTDDEAVAMFWVLLQTRIRAWGYTEEETLTLLLTTFSSFMDSEVIPNQEETAEPGGILSSFKAFVHCVFRSCGLAMRNQEVSPRPIVMPTYPKKREVSEFHSNLFECHCPRGYVFI